MNWVRDRGVALSQYSGGVDSAPRAAIRIVGTEPLDSTLTWSTGEPSQTAGVAPHRTLGGLDQKVGCGDQPTSPGSLHSFRVCRIAACEPFAAADIAVMHLGGNLNDPPGLPGCRARAQLHVFSIIPSRCGTALLTSPRYRASDRGNRRPTIRETLFTLPISVGASHRVRRRERTRQAPTCGDPGGRLQPIVPSG